MVQRYTIGIDYGTLSGRAVLVDVATGDIAATEVLDYPHAVMSRALPAGTPLPPDWALQHPQDYLDVLAATVPAVLSSAGVSGAQVIGLAIDFTGCTMLPIAVDGTPLCLQDEFAEEPHAYVKLWKHHSAQPYATRITEVAEALHEPWLSRYGGRISSEWMFPKIWETLDEAPAVYERATEFIEAGDWVVRRLTGSRGRSAALAGYKAMWDRRGGFPSDDYWRAVDERLVGVTSKLPGPYLDAGERAGVLRPAMADLLGLRAGTPVAVANSDAYVCAPAVGATEAGALLSIVGTSACTLALGSRAHDVPGVSGVVRDGILPGYFGYEAGQAAVGDIFAWFMREAVPARYVADANAAGRDLYEHMEALASALEPGESGLVALDWWNGNRSILVDGELSGVIVGMTLHTSSIEIYRCLLEASAFGMRKVIDAMIENGVGIDQVIVSGGISRKSPLLMQIYADVLGRQVRASQSPFGPALGSAIFAAVAAGVENSGHASIAEAADAMACRDDIVYVPDVRRHGIYERLFAEFEQLHDYFGRGGNEVMKRIRV